MIERLKIAAGLSAVMFSLIVLAAPSAQAKVMIMGNDGWEVSFDGSVNSFYVNAGKEEATGSDGKAVVTPGNYAGLNTDNNTTSRVTVGLLPAVLGINIKAPTMNGLDMGARFGLYPSLQNNDKQKNKFNSQNDFREAFFTVDGDFGQVLVGKTLSLFLGKNILTDMTLFGVGAVGANGPQGGTTTLGRIGHGYVYPNFNVGLRYSTPMMNGFKMTVGVYDPSKIQGSSTTYKGPTTTVIKPTPAIGATTNGVGQSQAEDAVTVAGGVTTITPAVGAPGADPAVIGDTTIGPGYDPINVNADETKNPRIEGEVSWAANMHDVDSTLWVNGMWQTAQRGGAQRGLCQAARKQLNVRLKARRDEEAKTKALAPEAEARYQDVSEGGCDEVTAWGVGAGAQMGWRGLTVTGSGYYGEGLGTTLMLDSNSLDVVGNERDAYGYIGQVTYAFGQGTSVGASYGGTYQQATVADRALSKGYLEESLDVTYDKKVYNLGKQDQIIKRQNLLDIMLWHDINANLRVVAEYGRQETGWMDGTSQNINIVSVGGFFFW